MARWHSNEHLISDEKLPYKIEITRYVFCFSQKTVLKKILNINKFREEVYKKN